GEGDGDHRRKGNYPEPWPGWLEALRGRGVAGGIGRNQLERVSARGKDKASAAEAIALRGIEILQTLAKAMNVDSHRGVIAGRIELAEYRVGDFRLGRRLRGRTPVGQVVEKFAQPPAFTERAAGLDPGDLSGECLRLPPAFPVGQLASSSRPNALCNERVTAQLP